MERSKINYIRWSLLKIITNHTKWIITVQNGSIWWFKIIQHALQQFNMVQKIMKIFKKKLLKVLVGARNTTFNCGQNWVIADVLLLLFCCCCYWFCCYLCWFNCCWSRYLTLQFVWIQVNNCRVVVVVFVVNVDHRNLPLKFGHFRSVIAKYCCWFTFKVWSKLGL